MASSPTKRTLDEMKKLGFTAQVVERWVPGANIRLDLFGCIDVIGIKPGVGIVGVQACAGGSHATRRAKMLAEPRMREWFGSGGRLELWSWAKRGARGKQKRWTLRREEITAADLVFDPVTIEPAAAAGKE